jgi:hypothetical protein
MWLLSWIEATIPKEVRRFYMDGTPTEIRRPERPFCYAASARYFYFQWLWPLRFNDRDSEYSLHFS